MEDQVIQKIFRDKIVNKPFTTAEFCNVLGSITTQKAKYPESSFVSSAFNFDISVYISTQKELSLSLNLANHRLNKQQFKIDLVRKII